MAWDRRLIFTIGTSSTTGESDTVVWNEIHHKTEFGSNLTGHGYPDPNYLDNVLTELSAQGVGEDNLKDWCAAVLLDRKTTTHDALPSPRVGILHGGPRRSSLPPSHKEKYPAEMMAQEQRTLNEWHGDDQYFDLKIPLLPLGQCFDRVLFMADFLRGLKNAMNAKSSLSWCW